MAIMAGRVSVLLAGLMIDLAPMLLETGVQVRMFLGIPKDLFRVRSDFKTGVE